MMRPSGPSFLLGLWIWLSPFVQCANGRWRRAEKVPIFLFLYKTAYLRPVAFV